MKKFELYRCVLALGKHKLVYHGMFVPFLHNMDSYGLFHFMHSKTDGMVFANKSPICSLSLIKFGVQDLAIEMNPHGDIESVFLGNN